MPLKVKSLLELFLIQQASVLIEKILAVAKRVSVNRWDCNKDTSVSGPAVLTTSLPTGYILDKEERSRLSKNGHEVWVKDQTVVIFFHKVRKNIF